MLIKRDPVASVSQQIGEYGLAALDRLPPEVSTVEFDQIESAEHSGRVADRVFEHTPRAGFSAPNGYCACRSEVRPKVAGRQAIPAPDRSHLIVIIYVVSRHKN